MYVIISVEWCEEQITTTYLGSFATKEDAIERVRQCKKSLEEFYPEPEYVSEDELGYYFEGDDGYVNEVNAFEDTKCQSNSIRLNGLALFDGDTEKEEGELHRVISVMSNEDGGYTLTMDDGVKWFWSELTDYEKNLVNATLKDLQQ